MGCSPSKELQNAGACGRSRGSWKDLLPNGLSVQVDDPLKSSEAHYIAAILSANYRSVRRSVPFNHGNAAAAAHATAAVLDLYPAEPAGSKKKDGSMDKGRGGAGSNRKGAKGNLISEKRLMMARYAERETVNAWELMEGLQDIDESSSCCSLDTAPRVPQQLLLNWKSSSIDRIADDDRYQAVQVTPRAPPNASTLMSSTSTFSSRHDDDVKSCKHYIQRALSSKYMFSHADYSDDLNLSLGSLSPSKFTAAADAPSSPEFSAAASLKDWLQPSADSRNFCSSSRKLFADEFISRTTSIILEEGVHRYPWPRRGQSGNDDEPMAIHNRPLTLVEGGSRSGVQDYNNLETSTAAVFDPELLEALERAMAQLSKEEWNALRSTEENPLNAVATGDRCAR